MKTIGDLLKVKGRRVWSIDSQESVYNALELMAEAQIGALAVVDDEQLVGIFSERDYARKIVLQGRSSSTTAVGEVMTARVVVVNPSRTVAEALAVMTDKRVRHLPVMAAGKLAGLVSIGDLVKATLSEQTFASESLAEHVGGQPSGR